MRSVQLLLIVLFILTDVRAPALAKSQESAASPSAFSHSGFSDTGKQGVLERSFRLPDSKRGKEIALTIFTPAGPGKSPLIIFSHGAFGNRDSYKPLVYHWVSHGYTVIAPTHQDSMKLFVQSIAGDRTNIREKFAQFKRRTFSLWHERPRDIKAILDCLDLLEQEIPELSGKLDRERIGVGGHSFGAHTSQIIGGTIAGGSTRLADPRPDAVLLISPQGVSNSSGILTPSSWRSFDRPMMTITGTEDRGRNGEPFTWRLDPYKYSPVGDKYLLVIDGADHGFGGITTRRFNPANKIEPAHVNWVKASSLAYWDAYLKGSKPAKAFLSSLARATNNRVAMYTK